MAHSPQFSDADDPHCVHVYQSYSVKMRLPNGEEAVVEERKLRDYVLNVGHPWDGTMRRFFASCSESALPIGSF